MPASLTAPQSSTAPGRTATLAGRCPWTGRRPARLNTGAVTEARQAASLILLRDSDAGPEVLLVRRNPQRLHGRRKVFLGGALNDADADHAAAAMRELEEEAGIRLSDSTAPVPFSRWITPAQVKVRFDTWFFARGAAGARATCDGSECVDAR